MKTSTITPDDKPTPHIITDLRSAVPKLEDVLHSFGSNSFEKEEYIEKAVQSKVDKNIAKIYLFRLYDAGELLIKSEAKRS